MTNLKAKNRTPAQQEQIDFLQWHGGLYLNKKEEIIIPAENLEATLIRGAMKQKRGPDAKSGILCQDAILEHPLKGKGLAEMYESSDPDYKFVRGVVVNRGRVFTTRPCIPDWRATVCVQFEDEIVSKDELRKWLVEAGANIGIGDWRPKFGRFTVMGK